jgi:hypothetical protein
MMPGDGNQPMAALSEQRRFMLLGQPVGSPLRSTIGVKKQETPGA